MSTKLNVLQYEVGEREILVLLLSDLMFMIIALNFTIQIIFPISLKD